MGSSNLNRGHNNFSNRVLSIFCVVRLQVDHCVCYEYLADYHCTLFNLHGGFLCAAYFLFAC